MISQAQSLMVVCKLDDGLVMILRAQVLIVSIGVMEGLALNVMSNFLMMTYLF